MAHTIAESETNTHTVQEGRLYVFSIAGTWDGMTATLKWSDGTTDVDIDSWTADAAIEVRAPTNTFKVVTGADSSNAGSLLYNLFDAWSKH